jgi:dTDP-4-amino-4,6-dideoxygalactose transaminase
MIPLINFKTQNNIYRKKILSGINKNLKNGDFILGNNVSLLENKIAKYVNAKYCVTCSSGTDALLMSLMAHNIKAGDIIFTTVYSYISTAEVIKILGAIPIFVDVDPRTYNIDSLKLQETIQNIKKKIFKPNIPKILKNINKINLKGIIAVNLFGNPINYEKINKIAKKNNLFLVEDAAQSFGSKYKKRLSGTLGDISCFSFYPTKSLSCYGDGGAITTNNKKIYKILRSIRIHGRSEVSGNFERIGITGRLDTIQATVLLEKLKNFNLEQKSRKRIAEIYQDRFKKTKDVKIQKIEKYTTSTFSVFSLEFSNTTLRNEKMSKLKKNKIGFNIYYRKPMHLEKVFSYLGLKKNSFPVAERLSKNILSIPIDPYMSKKELNRIISVIND